MPAQKEQVLYIQRRLQAGGYKIKADGKFGKESRRLARDYLAKAGQSVADDVAMEERQVSVDGETYPLPQPFIVMATQNPTEQLGTFPLPESQLDRFMMRLSMGYPAAEAEKQLYLQGGSRSSAGSLQAVCDARQLQQWQQQVSQVTFAQAAADYVYRLVQATRQSGRFAAGLSPRAGLAVVGAAKAWAFMQGRGHVLPDDIKSVWVAVANHRVKPVQQGLTSAQVLTDLLNHVAV